MAVRDKLSLPRRYATGAVASLLLVIGLICLTHAADAPVSSVAALQAPVTAADMKVLAERLASDDPVVHHQALHAIVDGGDASRLAVLEEVLSDLDRATRVAVKPVKDLLKNKLNLLSAFDDTRRSAATDLGSSGQVVAVPWLEQAAATEQSRWVRYAMEESAA